MVAWGHWIKGRPLLLVSNFIHGCSISPVPSLSGSGRLLEGYEEIRVQCVMKGPVKQFDKKFLVPLSLPLASLHCIAQHRERPRRDQEYRSTVRSLSLGLGQHWAD